MLKTETYSIDSLEIDDYLKKLIKCDDVTHNVEDFLKVDKILRFLSLIHHKHELQIIFNSLIKKIKEEKLGDINKELLILTNDKINEFVCSLNKHYFLIEEIYVKTYGILSKFDKGIPKRIVKIEYQLDILNDIRNYINEIRLGINDINKKLNLK